MGVDWREVGPAEVFVEVCTADADVGGGDLLTVNDLRIHRIQLELKTIEIAVRTLTSP